jgi:hypothetical protein
LFPAGYLLVLVQGRYLWGWLLLILILGSGVLGMVMETGLLSPPARRLLAAVFAFSFLQLPARQLFAQRNSGRPLFELSRRIRQHVPLSGNVVACSHWNESVQLAYYLHLRLYGTTAYDSEEREINHWGDAGMDADAITRQLLDNHVNYYIAWADCAATPPPYVVAHEEITQGQIPELRIYRLTARASGR